MASASSSTNGASSSSSSPFKSLRKKSSTDKPLPVRPFLPSSQCLDADFAGLRLSPKASNQEFTILKTLSFGDFSRLYLSRPDESHSDAGVIPSHLVLKAFRASASSFEEFLSEVDLNYFFSPHPNIVSSYNVFFSSSVDDDLWYLYPMEYAPYGPLSSRLTKSLSEDQVKSVASQVCSALGFIHSVNLIHRDVVPENVLVFRRDFSVVKLSDFGSMVDLRTLLVKGGGEEGNMTSVMMTGVPKLKLPYVPPEIWALLPQEKYHCYPSIDVWQVGVLLYTCLSGGGFPWKMADPLRDPSFNLFVEWTKRKVTKTPSAFGPFSSRLNRLLKRLLEPKPTKRCGVEEVNKYLKDEWVQTQTTTKSSSSTTSLTVPPVDLNVRGSLSRRVSTNVTRSHSDVSSKASSLSPSPVSTSSCKVRRVTVTGPSPSPSVVKRKTVVVRGVCGGKRQEGTSSTASSSTFKMTCVSLNRGDLPGQ